MGKKQTQTLPALPCLRCELVAAGGNDYDSKVLTTLKGTDCGPGNNYIAALIKISTEGSVVQGDAFMPWDREANAQRALYGRVADGYTVHVEEVWENIPPIYVPLKKQRFHGGGGQVAINQSSRIYKGWFDVHGVAADNFVVGAVSTVLRNDSSHPVNGARTTAKDILPDFTSADDLPVLKVPWPIVALILTKRFSTLFLSVSWHGGTAGRSRYEKIAGPIPGHPPQAHCVWEHVGEIENVVPLEIDGFDLGPENLERVLQHLNETVLEVVRLECDRGANQITKARSQQFSNLLEGWINNMYTCLGVMSCSSKPRRLQFSSDCIVQCLRLLQKYNVAPLNLAGILHSAGNVTMPECLQALHGNLVQATLCSRSLLGRMTLALDMAMLLLVRERPSAQRACVRYELSDASFLKGYDWLWSQYHELDLIDAWDTYSAYVNIYDAIHEYCRENRQLDAEVELPADDLGDAQPIQTWDWRSHYPLETWSAWLATLEHNFRENVNPPMALGGGHRRLADKASTEVYKWALQSKDMASLELFSQSFIGHCGIPPS